MFKLGFIGLGNMGKAMLSGALKNKYVKNTEVIFRKNRNPEEIVEKYKVTSGKDNIEIAEKSKIIVLAVKPNIYAEIIEEIKDSVSENTIIMNITPSFSIKEIQNLFGKNIKVARAMPNTPAMVNAGITGLCFSDNMTDSDKEDIINFTNSFGETVIIKEDLMGGLSAISGSGPAYIYMLIEAMADAGVKEGISRKDSYKLAAKTVEGAAKMVLETGIHPGELKDNVCSPGGTTIAGVIELENNGFRSSIIKGIGKTVDRFKEMNEEK